MMLQYGNTPRMSQAVNPTVGSVPARWYGNTVGTAPEAVYHDQKIAFRDAKGSLLPNASQTVPVPDVARPGYVPETHRIPIPGAAAAVDMPRNVEASLGWGGDGRAHVPAGRKSRFADLVPDGSLGPMELTATVRPGQVEAAQRRWVAEQRQPIFKTGTAVFAGVLLTLLVLGIWTAWKNRA